MHEKYDNPDYGDNWRHRVKVEKIVELDTPISSAVCVAGENACPPEDVGSASAYEEFLSLRSSCSGSLGSASAANGSVDPSIPRRSTSPRSTSG
ncbi:hypothetical protein QZH52_30005 [Variovorax ginsengisoli]|uniref:Plasmid pRiA4b Orf3-like domain-containing protein n=1 Tax=Variovorax ginsengisoli TaxID=363844 RepID=A0ABT8SGB7_9BURK|nr:hypothetical protein [Variovorax ginsengisoli]MDN8617356.1 hypothetical protein [Variovorax ginsengisoli]MDO1536526.1 hypothetical protein [Variovorax ginsengisoli]